MKPALCYTEISWNFGNLNHLWLSVYGEIMNSLMLMIYKMFNTYKTKCYDLTDWFLNLYEWQIFLTRRDEKQFTYKCYDQNPFSFIGRKKWTYRDLTVSFLLSSDIAIHFGKIWLIDQWERYDHSHLKCAKFFKL